MVCPCWKNSVKLTAESHSAQRVTCQKLAHRRVCKTCIVLSHVIKILWWAWKRTHGNHQHKYASQRVQTRHWGLPFVENYSVKLTAEFHSAEWLVKSVQKIRRVVCKNMPWWPKVSGALADTFLSAPTSCRIQSTQSLRSMRKEFKPCPQPLSSQFLKLVWLSYSLSKLRFSELFMDRIGPPTPNYVDNCVENGQQMLST